VPAGAALPGKYLGVTHRLFRVRKARAQMSAGLAVSSDTPIEQSNGTLVDSVTFTSSWRICLRQLNFTALWINYLYADVLYFQTNSILSLAKTMVTVLALNLMIILMHLMSPNTLIRLKNFAFFVAASFQMFKR